MMTISSFQKKVWDILIDKYEKSATYRGDESRRQNFIISPSEILPDYFDFVDLDKFDLFNREMISLEKENVVLVVFDRYHRDIQKISLNVENAALAYSLIGRIEIKEKRNEELAMYRDWLNKDDLIKSFCQ